jgi:hypothetical protein
MPQPHEHIPATARSLAAIWRGRALLTIAIIAAAVLLADRAGVITFPGTKQSAADSQTGAEAVLAAKRAAATQQWASALCSNLLQWKTAIQRDATSLDLGFGAPARISDAIATTTHTLSALDKLGLPPAGHGARARAETNELRYEIASRVKSMKDAAGSLAGGNLAAVGTLFGDLKQDTAAGTQVVSEIRHIVSVDLGLSLAETRACRQLVGIPV